MDRAKLSHYNLRMLKSFTVVAALSTFAWALASCSSESKGGVGVGDASTSSNGNDGGIAGSGNGSNGGTSNGGSSHDDTDAGNGSSNGGSAGSNGSGGNNGAGDLCGDTTDVDSFFESHRDIQIPVVYEAGTTGFEDAYLEPGWKLDFAIIGEDKIVILVEPPGGTMQLGGYNASTDTYEDSELEVNLMLDPDIAYDVIVQCTKATGDFTVVMTANNDPMIWTRWVSE